MSMQFVDCALNYFSKCKLNIGSSAFRDMEADIMRADNSERLELLLAILRELLTARHQIPEEVLIGGLRLVSDPGASFLPYSVFAEDVDPVLQLRAVRDMERCFSEIFSEYCHQESLPDSKYAVEWNSLCFMWWEIIPRHGVPFKRQLQCIDLAVLDALKNILQLENLGCKESALHGLLHWQHAYPDEVAAILASNAHLIPPELRDYAFQITSNHS